jgi:hypothetical protein
MFLFDDLIHLRKKNVVGFLLNRKKLYFQIMDFKLVLRIFFYLIFLNWLTAFIKLNVVLK